ncbi:MAG: DUF4293 family protein [Saprospiraceae bacterium]|jgi:hypothetical protein|nr:DUF4293 family protein [Saprospiraceae bacterium]MCA0332529.1 DUF4293 domain-containing protein [Bacteroidota bacterium]MCB0603327.1 DUF4293 family protein [Saprospiraceae bacterium]HRG44037.1 DUF4293 family protein [Saprospiraceae bacterium]
MIQRIQSVFLLLAATCMSFLFLPSFDYAASSDAQIMTTPLFKDSVFNTFDNIALMVMTGITSLLIFINIFLFKNRTLQLLLVKILIFLIFALIISAGIIFYLNFNTQLEEIARIQVRLGTFIPFIVIVLLYFTSNYIKKDISIVKSMDRLR